MSNSYYCPGCGKPYPDIDRYCSCYAKPDPRDHAIQQLDTQVAALKEILLDRDAEIVRLKAEVGELKKCCARRQLYIEEAEAAAKEALGTADGWREAMDDAQELELAAEKRAEKAEAERDALKTRIQVLAEEAGCQCCSGGPMACKEMVAERDVALKQVEMMRRVMEQIVRCGDIHPAGCALLCRDALAATEPKKETK